MERVSASSGWNAAVSAPQFPPPPRTPSARSRAGGGDGAATPVSAASYDSLQPALSGTSIAPRDPERSCQLLIRDAPERALAIVSSTHALIFRHSTARGGVGSGGGAGAGRRDSGFGYSDVELEGGRGGGYQSDAGYGGDGRGGSHTPPRPKCMVRLVPLSGRTLNNFRPLTPRPIYGTLGLMSISGEVFLCVVTHATRVATLRPGETVERILSVDFYCLNHAGYDDTFGLGGVAGGFPGSDVLAEFGGPGDLGYGSRHTPPPPEQHPCHELQKLLGNGSFYFSTDFDLTNRLQDRPVDVNGAGSGNGGFGASRAFDIDNFDESFLWNSFMIGPLLEFRSRLLASEREALDASRILTSAIRGFCLTVTIPQSSAPLRTSTSAAAGGRNAGLPSYLTVISRLSCRRAGTRFNARGIDDDGNVANFVETETIYWSPLGVLFSYAQVRGSVPVFWEQSAGLIPGQQKIVITRSADGTQHAFDKHFEDLEQTYGAVHVVNLLSEAKQGEAELTSLFHYGIDHCSLSRGVSNGHGGADKHGQDHALLRMTDYDFHAETKGAQGYEAAQNIRRYIESSADGFAYFLAEEIDDNADISKEQQPAGRSGSGGDSSRRFVVVLQQEGVFRTNCLDCLDRTNLIQTIISQLAVESFLRHRGERASPDFWMRHSSLWADNGDSLSKIYAGTGALKSSFTRHGKMSIAGAIADARKSATRLYINNFADKGRQNTIDMLLGRLVGQVAVVLFDPINDVVSAELNKRSAEFSSTETITIFVGTFNLNGRTDGIGEDLSPWICPSVLGKTQPEIVAIGFQEIVELNPQQIMSSDPARKQEWEAAIKATLNERARRIGGEKYVLLRSGQLVGAALCIFVRASCLPKIKNVEGSVKKTGLSGIAGNKGAVAIRLDYANTQICFVTAHLAAGFANYDERNKDYATIHHGLRFQRNRGIDDHDTVIWLGDFNYRIGLTLEKARELIKKRDIEQLYENDQLNLQMLAGLAFQYYSEARITFMPTYKFDIGSDNYDSSEKARIPAWTDRILRKGANLRQLSYNSAPLRFSDHRPVYATFECTVGIVNEALRDKISREIYERQKEAVGGSTAPKLEGGDMDDEDVVGYDAVEPGLPPASSDRQKWWLENGKMARSSVAPPRSEDGRTTILNPKRPSNPFTPTDEPDWVSVPRAPVRAPSSSQLSTSPWEHITESQILPVHPKPPPRKLPPPFDPKATLPSPAGRRAASEEPSSNKDSSRHSPPAPPPPRRHTTSAKQQENSAKPASTPSSERTTAPPPPPPPARAASSTSSTKSKHPPPVAKKPAHLATAGSPTAATNTSTPETSSPSLASLTSGPGTTKPHPPRRPSSAVFDNSSPRLYSHGHAGGGTNDASSGSTETAAKKQAAPPPKPLKRIGTNGTVSSSGDGGSNGRPTALPGAVGLPGLSGDREAKPALPARPSMSSSVSSASSSSRQPPPPKPRTTKMPAPTDLLDDDVGTEMGSWEALAPATQQQR